LISFKLNVREKQGRLLLLDRIWSTEQTNSFLRVIERRLCWQGASQHPLRARNRQLGFVLYFSEAYRTTSAKIFQNQNNIKQPAALTSGILS
jgi:hypothetical protein